MFSLLARHPDGRTLPFIQYVATMAAVDAIQEAADQALVDAGVAGAGFRRGTGRTVDVRVKWRTTCTAATRRSEASSAPARTTTEGLTWWSGGN